MGTITEDINLRNKNYVFRDRFHAGELLADKLKPYMNPIILAIPSGGVPVGAAIAEKLSIALDLLIVRKIPIPYSPEAGFGSVSWDGEVTINERLLSQLHLSDEEIKAAIDKVKLELKKRMEKFRGKKPFPELKGRSVILVDDGLASGYTMLSAVSAVKRHSPARITVAVPTASKNALELVSKEVDELVCLNVRETAMFAVADAYKEWYDLDEREVIGILKRWT